MKRYRIKTLEHGLVSDFPSLHTPYGFTPDILNCKVDQHSIKNRFGLGTADRDFGSGVEVQSIVLYTLNVGTRYTLYLTRDYVDYSGSSDMVIVGDLCLKKTGTSETFQYVTEMDSHTSKITGIVGDTVTATGTTFATDGVAAGDYFVINDTTDFKYPYREPLTNSAQNASHWMIIESVANTVLTLKATYTGQTSAASDTWSGTPKSCLIRKTFKVPANERYAHCIVTDKFIFGSGGDCVKVWTGAGYATDLNATYFINARYLTEYANRLILADLGTVRDPLLLMTSDEGDPTTYDTSASSASYSFIETDDNITGLMKVASYLVVAKRESLIIGGKTAKALDPLRFPTQRPGSGCVAPYSIVHARGTSMFLGNADFMYMDSDLPKPLSRSKARYKFFDIVDPTEATRTWGYFNALENEVQWFANTENGKFAFVLNLMNDEWSIFDYAVDIMGAGRGEK